MFLRTFICALILAFTILLATSPVNAAALPPTPAKRMTNGERMARGLPPNPPNLIRRSRKSFLTYRAKSMNILNCCFLLRTIELAKRGASKAPEPTAAE